MTRPHTHFVDTFELVNFYFIFCQKLISNYYIRNGYTYDVSLRKNIIGKQMLTHLGINQKRNFLSLS